VADDLYIWGVGRRKTSVARVRLRRGTGRIVVNNRDADDYFKVEWLREAIKAPLKATKTLGKYDIFANIEGGGPTGQAGALLLGIARALHKADSSLDPPLREGGFLTRDSRMKERKKYGQKGARKRFQYSKR